MYISKKLNIESPTKYIVSHKEAIYNLISKFEVAEFSPTSNTNCTTCVPSKFGNQFSIPNQI